jgi:hypothetical protein
MEAPAVEQKLPAAPAQGLPQTPCWPITLPQAFDFSASRHTSNFTLDSASTHCFGDFYECVKHACAA